MLKTMKKIVLVLLALALIFTASACKSGKNANLDFGADLSQDTILTKEPVEFTYFHTASEAEDGQWDVLKEAARMTNVNLRVTVSPAWTVAAAVTGTPFSRMPCPCFSSEITPWLSPLPLRRSDILLPSCCSSIMISTVLISRPEAFRACTRTRKWSRRLLRCQRRT